MNKYDKIKLMIKDIESKPEDINSKNILKYIFNSEHIGFISWFYNKIYFHLIDYKYYIYRQSSKTQSTHLSLIGGFGDTKIMYLDIIYDVNHYYYFIIYYFQFISYQELSVVCYYQLYSFIIIH